jgi:hypothetical protein
MNKFNLSSTRALLRTTLVAAIVATAVACFTVPALAGPKGTVHVRPLGDRKLTIDGDISDWPLAQFKKVAQQPVFPAGQTADSTTADGDYLVFDKTRIGLFNGTTTDAFQANESDFGVTTYFAHDFRNLYILAVFIDDILRDDNDTSQFGSSGFLNDGFEFFLDAKGDSTDCISDDAFPAIDQAEPNLDDFQVTVAINSTFKPAGSATNVLGARQSIERAGNLDLIGPDKAGPGGIYRDQLDAGPGPDIAAKRYDDLRAAGALNPELAAKPNVKFTGYVIEMRVPLRGKIPDVVANHAMGFEIFWRDVDDAGDPGAGGSNISWASWAQSTDVPCTDPKTSLFNTANWGQLVFDDTDPLVPIPAAKPTILFVTTDSFTTIHADIDLIEFFQDNGYAVVPFTSTGSTPEDLQAAAAGKKLVFISETIGSTSVVDPAGSATGVFSLKDTDVPVISFEAFMYDNADWVVRTDDGSNDFSKWGNSGRNDNDGLPIGVPPEIQDARDSLYIKNSTHPITQGFSGKVKVYVDPYSFNYGIVSPDADVLATIQPDGSFPTLFVYEKGDKLADGSVAPNKRIGLFLGQIASPNANTDPVFANLTADGKKLILNTVAYAIGASTPPPPTLQLSATRVANKIRVTWTDSAAKLESASTVNGTYTAVANATSPYDQDISSAQQQFFRLKK